MQSSLIVKSLAIVLVGTAVLWAQGGDARQGRVAAKTGVKESKIGLFSWYKVDSDWPRKPAGFTWGDMPGVAIDSEDRVWIFTRATPPVQVYNTDGKFLFSWGEGTVAKSHHIKIGPEGHIWLSDVGDHVIRKCTTEGKVLLTLGTPGQSGEDDTHLNQPTDMAISPAGDIFVSDGYGNNRVVHFDKNGKFVKTWGKLGKAPGDFHLPHAIAMDSKGRLYVADRTNARVQVFDQDGTFLDEWDNLIVPWGFCVTADDEIWVCGSSPMPSSQGGVPCCPPKDQLLMKFTPQGKLLQLWTAPKGSDGQEKPGELNWLHAMAVDSRGNIYAGDIKGKRAQKFVLQK